MFVPAGVSWDLLAKKWVLSGKNIRRKCNPAVGWIEWANHIGFKGA